MAPWYARSVAYRALERATDDRPIQFAPLLLVDLSALLLEIRNGGERRDEAEQTLAWLHELATQILHGRPEPASEVTH